MHLHRYPRSRAGSPDQLLTDSRFCGTTKAYGLRLQAEDGLLQHGVAGVAGRHIVPTISTAQTTPIGQPWLTSAPSQ